MNKIVEFSFPYVDIYFKTKLETLEYEYKIGRNMLIEKIFKIILYSVVIFLLSLVKAKLANIEIIKIEYPVTQSMIESSIFICNLSFLLLAFFLFYEIVDLLFLSITKPLTKKRFAKKNKDKLLKTICKDFGCCIDESNFIFDSNGFITGLKGYISLKQKLDKRFEDEVLEYFNITKKI